MILEHFLTPYTKINSKWIKNLSVRLDMIKLLEENTGNTLIDINHSKTFFYLPPRVMKIKTNNWDLIKCKLSIKDIFSIYYYKGVYQVITKKPE